MRIIAYTFEADAHCPHCTAQRFGSFNKFRTNSDGLLTGHHDEHGIAFDLTDREGNPIHPVFSTDEHDFTHCGDCHQPL